MTRPDIEGLRALVEAMTPGEWRADDDVVVVGPDDADPREAVVSFYHPPFGTPHAYNNAIGCAALRNAAPALLDHIARLEAALGEAVDTWQDTVDAVANGDYDELAYVPDTDGRTIARLRALLPGTKETAP